MPTWWRNEKGYVEEAGALHQLGRLALLQMGGRGGGARGAEGQAGTLMGGREQKEPPGSAPGGLSPSLPSGMSGWQKLRSRQLRGGIYWVGRGLGTGRDPKAGGYLGIPRDTGRTSNTLGCSGNWQVRPKRQSDLPHPLVEEGSGVGLAWPGPCGLSHPRSMF